MEGIYFLILVLELVLLRLVRKRLLPLLVVVLVVASAAAWYCSRAASARFLDL